MRLRLGPGYPDGVDPFGFGEALERALSGPLTVEALVERGHALEDAKAALASLVLTDMVEPEPRSEAALEGADALVICTEWKEFRALDVDLFLDRLSRRLVVDGRNLYEPAKLRAAGVRYLCVGRPA